MPDRRAKFLRNSFYLSQLDGEGMRRQEEQDQLKDREAVWKRQEEQAKDEIKKLNVLKVWGFKSFKVVIFI